MSAGKRWLAIGIEGPNHDQIERWIAEGRLPTLARLQAEGASARVTHNKRFRNERCWDLFLSGSDRARPGSTFLPAHYRYQNDSPQRDTEQPLFYALGDTARVCAFDLPAPIDAAVNGLQVSGWGSELNAAAAMSSPAQLVHELIHRYGADPKLTQSGTVFDPATGEPERSYRVPSLYDAAAVASFRRRLLLSVRRRTAIAHDLLAREPWDLFIALYPEAHSANHQLWHLGEAHPLGGNPALGNATLEITQAIDAAIGSLLDTAPACGAFVFTIDSTAANHSDLPTMALLPELLYRWCFPGHTALAPGAQSGQSGQGAHPHWKQAVWARCTPEGQARLESPAAQEAAGEPLSWNPANWYRPLWPQMRAFALPSVSDGYVRLNVRGREAQGLVDPQEFAALLGEITALLLELVEPRSGRPMVEQVLPTRRTPDEHPEIPPDLVVCWRCRPDDLPADLMDSATLGRNGRNGRHGRIGPLPFFRSGGHAPHGATVPNRCWARGPGIAPGTRWRDGELVDLPATLLQLLGQPLPPHMSGHSLAAR